MTGNIATDEAEYIDIPTWMRQSNQSVDWGILVVIVFSALAAWSFIMQSGVPRTNASENYVFMADDYARAILEGRLYPRWSAAALQGYGAPIAHYYPPGVPYSAMLLQILFTNNPILAVRLLYILSFVLAGSMLYVFVARWADASAGFLASVLSIYSPYLGFTAPHVFGDLPMVMGMALLSACLWATSRLLVVNRAFDFMMTALSICALILVEPRLAPVFCGMTLALMLFNRRWRAAVRVAMAVLSGVLLAGVYWIPAVLERDLVTWREPTIQPIPVTLDWLDLILPMPVIDLNALLPAPQLRLGLALVVLIPLALMLMLRVRHGRTFHLMFLILGIMITFIALFILPGEVWLLGPMTLCFAVFASAAVHLRLFLPTTYQRLVMPGLVMLALMLALPTWLHPIWTEQFDEVSLSEQIRYEQQGYGIAILPARMPVPVTIEEDIKANQTLINSYTSENVTRLPQRGQSVEHQANLLKGFTHEDRYLLNSTVTAEFDILRAYFPGWQAIIGGQEVEITADKKTGLIRITVPPVHNENLVIRMGSTSIRTAAWVISGVVLAGLILMLLLRLSGQSTGVFYNDLPLLSLQETRLVSVIFIGFVAAIWFFARPESQFSLHARPGYSLDNSYELRNLTDVGLEVISYDLNRVMLSDSDTLEVTISWRTLRPLLSNYRAQVALRDSSQGLLWQQTEAVYPGGYPTKRWATHRFVTHTFEIPIIDMPSGNYEIVLSMFDEPFDRLTFFDKDGGLIGQRLPLPMPIMVTHGNADDVRLK